MDRLGCSLFSPRRHEEHEEKTGLRGTRENRGTQRKTDSLARPRAERRVPLWVTLSILFPLSSFLFPFSSASCLRGAICLDLLKPDADPRNPLGVEDEDGLAVGDLDEVVVLVGNEHGGLDLEVADARG